MELALAWGSRGSLQAVPGSAAGLHIVPWEESSPLGADTLTPAIGVAAGDTDDGTLRERELVVLLAGVWVQCHHCRRRRQCQGDKPPAPTVGVPGAHILDSREHLGEKAAGNRAGSALSKALGDPSPAELTFNARPAASLPVWL